MDTIRENSLLFAHLLRNGLVQKWITFNNKISIKIHSINSNENLDISY